MDATLEIYSIKPSTHSKLAPYQQNMRELFWQGAAFEENLLTVFFLQAQVRPSKKGTGRARKNEVGNV